MPAGAEPPIDDALRLAHIDLLAGIDIFENLNRVALAQLAAYLEPRRLLDGEVLFHQGDPGDALYVVAQGVVSVYTATGNGGTETRLAAIGRGQYFGEIALIVDEPRTASVRAVGSAEVLGLERSCFLELIRSDPAVALAVTAKVIGHLRSADRARSQDVVGLDIPEPASFQDIQTPRALTDALRATRGVQPIARSRGWVVGCIALTMAFALAALVASVAGADHAWVFLLLLGGAAVLWASNLLASSMVGLSLLVSWLLFGIATPDQAAAGFGSSSWLFIVSIFGLTAAVARSGLLFRIGLLMVRRLPTGLFWQAGGLLLTGAALGAIVPSSSGRAGLMTPLARAVSQALRQRDREPGSAVLGLAAWIGAGPMLFVFLNASSTTLLAWGLLPAESRARIDWVHWFVSVLPLTVLVVAGSLPLLALTLGPVVARAPSAQRLGLQLTILGPLQRREWAMLAVLGFTLVGWLLGPLVGLSAATVAIIALLGAFVSGNLDRQALRELNWDYLLFFGIVLSMTGLSTTLGVSRLAATMLGAPLARTGMPPPVFLFVVAGLMALVRLVLLPEPALLLVGLALIPVAPALGIEPALVVVAMVSTMMLWYLPSQSPEYMIAYAASDGKLYSHAQSRRVAFGFAGLVLVGLALSVPYWRLLGLL